MYLYVIRDGELMDSKMIVNAGFSLFNTLLFDREYVLRTSTSSHNLITNILNKGVRVEKVI